MKASSKLRITKSVGDEYGDRKPPKGAKIISQNVSTTSEPIENGWLVTKSYDGKYKLPTDKESSDGCIDCGASYFNYSQKWFSKTDPLTVTVNDKELADVFPDEEEE